MSVTDVKHGENCVYILVLIAGVWNKLIVVSLLMCKVFIPWNEYSIAVAENNQNSVCRMVCVIRNCRVAVLFAVNKNIFKYNTIKAS